MITTEFIVTWQTTRKREKGKTYSHVFTDLEKARSFKKDEENIKKLQCEAFKQSYSRNRLGRCF